MKRLLILLALLLPVCAFAADNLTGLDQDGKVVVVKDGLAFKPMTITANATVVDESFLQLNSINATMTVNYTPAIGQLFVVTQTGTNTDVSTVLLPTGLTWNGTNRGATFNAAAETLVGFRASSSRVVILENLGTVGFSN